MITAVLKGTANLFGVEVRRRSTTPAKPRFAPHPLPFGTLPIDLVLDVGANKGQFARSLREKGWRGKIISFEPLSDAYEALVTNASDDPHWQVHPRCAVGAKPGTSVINIAGNSMSSSLLPMHETHQQAAPESVYIGTEEIRMETLDRILPKYVKKPMNIHLKMDTQGFEKHVLDGAELSLNKLSSIQLELSVRTLYEGSPLYGYFFEYLTEKGFVLWDMLSLCRNPNTGQLLWFDGVFVKKELSETREAG